MTITKKEKSALEVLKQFFGYPADGGVREFKVELDELTDEEKLELARLAAVELDLTEDEVKFALTDSAAA